MKTLSLRECSVWRYTTHQTTKTISMVPLRINRFAETCRNAPRSIQISPNVDADRYDEHLGIPRFVNQECSVNSLLRASSFSVLGSEVHPVRYVISLESGRILVKIRHGARPVRPRRTSRIHEDPPSPSTHLLARESETLHAALPWRIVTTQFKPPTRAQILW